MTRDDALNALRANTTRQRDLNQQLADAADERLHLIAAARAATPKPASWSEIGDAIEQGRSNAYNTYNDKVNAILAATATGEKPTVTALAITDTRAELLRAIDNGKVKTNRRSGETYHDEYAGRRTRVTGKVKVMLLVGLVERVDHDDDRTDLDVRLTDAGRKALAEYDATTSRQP